MNVLTQASKSIAAALGKHSRAASRAMLLALSLLAHPHAGAVVSLTSQNQELAATAVRGSPSREENGPAESARISCKMKGVTRNILTGSYLHTE